MEVGSNQKDDLTAIDAREMALLGLQKWYMDPSLFPGGPSLVARKRKEVRALLSLPPPSLHLIQGSRSTRRRSQSSDGIWNHTAAAALRARASYAYHSPTLLQHALFGQYGVIREAAEPIALRSLYSCDSEGVVHTLKESRCEGSDRRSSRDGTGAP
ncbi:hypothetical protein ACH5RR_038696 [Cinchona calisaya]|uniref:Uncharacterized protein n=1 Tax=Cinchona calisaya TaxID=153742 RepID=A0ABD2XWK7_9GENT